MTLEFVHTIQLLPWRRTEGNTPMARWLGWVFMTVVCSTAIAADPWVKYPGGTGPGAGKKVVLISGDEEYRSEEALPQLGKILSVRHGFACTVLFAIDPDGSINPNRGDNIPGLEALATADLLIIATRFRNLPDEQMKWIADYLESGRPVMGLRTATHAFNLDKKSAYSHFQWNNAEGGFGGIVLGETWVTHHGNHGSQSTRGLFVPETKAHPILKGIADGEIWGPTDVYGVHLPLRGDSTPLVMGQVVAGMKPDDPAFAGEKNNPMMPIVWVKSYTVGSGKTGKAFTTTMGSSTDLENEGLRRLLVNATYWLVGLEKQIPDKTDVTIVGEFHPLKFGFNGAAKGVRPESHGL